jgi:hypothetical protein
LSALLDQRPRLLDDQHGALRPSITRHPDLAVKLRSLVAAHDRLTVRIPFGHIPPETRRDPDSLP